MFNLKKKSKILDQEGLKELSEPERDFNYGNIIVENTGVLEKKLIKIDDTPPESIPRYDGKFMSNLLGLNLDNKLWAIEPPNEIRPKKNPTDFYSSQAVVENLVNRAFKFSESITEKIKFGIFIALIIIELIFLFLIFSMGIGA